ncbi:PIN domain-containing protein [Testudinibacter sp. P80/BLE/0925]
MYGLAKRRNPTKLANAIRELLLCLDILPFDHAISENYGEFKVKVEKLGKSLAPLDMQIAAHAHSLQYTLITNEQAFFQIDFLDIEDWTK